MGRTSPDITGQRFGTWTALRRDGHIYGKQIAWLCQCECGTVRRVGSSLLRRGESKGCGCENHKALGQRALRHGKITHRLYDTWTAMHDRCRRPKHIAFPRYGGRGIKVCDRWQDFSLFLADMEPSWQAGLTLDRIDNDGPYSPGNCRWSTVKTQMRNKSTNRLLTFDGATRPLSEWAEVIGISSNALQLRLHKGWPIERALTTPPREW